MTPVGCFELNLFTQYCSPGNEVGDALTKQPHHRRKTSSIPSKLRHSHQAMTSIMLHRYCIHHDEQPKPFCLTKSNVGVWLACLAGRILWGSSGTTNRRSLGTGKQERVFLSHKILITLTDKFLNQLAPTHLCILYLVSSCRHPKLDIHQHTDIGNFLACLRTWCL